MFFEPDDLAKLQEEYSKISLEYKQIMLQHMNLQFKNKDTDEYARQGFMRRLGTLQRCIQNIYTICPPDKLNKPTKEELYDLGINLQSFVFNVYGCVDNMAWMWVKETDYKYTKNSEISFTNKKLRKSLTENFRNFLNGLEKWFDNLEDFRHALAHRIPLYVPPFKVTPEEAERYQQLEQKKYEAIKQCNSKKLQIIKIEQEKLGSFVPCMTHSFSEKAPLVGFHAQIISDWKTVIEIFKTLIKELKVTSTPPLFAEAN